MNNALVSIVMPTYNCANYISEAIDSVINQTYNNWEIQIVDDCSTDETSRIVEQYTKVYPNVHYIRLDNNSGPAVARTEAMKLAKGKYIAFLDSDDRWDNTKLEKQIQYMENNNILFSCTGYSCMSEDGTDLGYSMIPPTRTSYNKCIRLSNPIGNLTVIYNQEVLGKFKVPMIDKRNDFALWLQILKQTPYCYGMDEVLGTYRTGRVGSVSNRKRQQAKYHWQLYHKIEGHGLVRSSVEMLCWCLVKGFGIGLKKVKC